MSSTIALGLQARGGLSKEVKLKALNMRMQPPRNATHWSTRSRA